MASKKPIVYDELTILVDDCIAQFTEKYSDQDSCQSIIINLEKIQKNLVFVKFSADDIRKHVHEYDVTPGLHANGYRSVLCILENLLKTIAKMLRAVDADCHKIFFRANEYLDKLELCSDVLHQLRALLCYAQILISLTSDGQLFVDEEKSALFMHDCEIMAKACFYGSLHGFQYTGKMQQVMQSLSTVIAQYNDLHTPNDAWTLVKSAVNSGRYVLSPELRGEKLEKLYNSGDVEFMKKFWFLPEQGIIQKVPSLVGTAVHVNRVFRIPVIPITMRSCKDPANMIQISVSSSSSSEQIIQARLISYVLRNGQDDPSSPSVPDAGLDNYNVSFALAKSLPKSKNLVLFLHGGGFVSLTSKSYEVILRDWSKELDCPIFCVDYSLAPEDPFPRAFEECFYAYAWALDNAHLLGTTAEKIIFVGDSAGGNLILSVALQCGHEGVRMPDSILAIYPACVVQPCVSPARLMSVMDPILPLGIMSGCLSAYVGVKESWVKRENKNTHNEPDPVLPSLQPLRIKYLSNLKKDLEDSLKRIQLSSSWPRVEPTWWDEQFHVQIDEESNGTVRRRSITEVHSYHASDAAVLDSQFGALHTSTPCTDFQIKLPHNFKPLKSKFCGDSFRMRLPPVAKNAFMSPALAKDDLMKNLPHVDIVVCEFDPLLDDAVTLAKRLESLHKSYDLHMVKGLPHAFLNFQFGKEAVDAAATCSSEDIYRGAKRTVIIQTCLGESAKEETIIAKCLFTRT